MDSKKLRGYSITIGILLFSSVSHAGADACFNLFDNEKVSEVALKEKSLILSSATLLNPRVLSNINNQTALSLIRLGYTKTSISYKAMNAVNEILKSDLKKGDQLILENIDSSVGGYPIDFPHYFTHVTVQSDVKFHANGISFDAYNPVTNRTQTVSIKYENNKINSLYVKRFVSPSTTGLATVDPEIAGSNSPGFARSFAKRGYSWMGRLDSVSAAESKAKALDLYNKLNTGDEIIFLNQKNDIQKLVVLDKEFGLTRFLDSNLIDSAKSVQNRYLSKEQVLTLSPTELEKMMNLGTIMVGQVAEKAPLVADSNWSSQVEQLESNLQQANQAFIAGGNMTDRAAANPRAMQDGIIASQIAQAETKWAVAKIDLKNIMANRNLPSRLPFDPNRIDYRKLIVKTPISDGRTSNLIDFSSLVEKPMQIDVSITKSNSSQKINTRIEKFSDHLDLVFEVGTKKEATILFATLLESAYGHIIKDATHTSHLEDVRIDMDRMNEGQLVSKLRYRKKPVFEGQIEESNTNGSIELRISILNLPNIFHAESQLFQGLMWAHNLRFK